MTNDPVLGAIAWVPVDPAYPLQDAEYQSSIGTEVFPACIPASPQIVQNVTEVEPIELGFFPDYQVSD